MLKEKMELGRVTLKNRLVMAPVDLEKSDHGTVTDEQLSYYEERTRGGCFGLVVIEHSFVKPNGRATEHQLSVAKDENIAGLAKLAEVIHKSGSKTVMQLSHAGSAIKKAQVAEEGISPSGLASPALASDRTLQRTHAMTHAEIGDLVEHFALAAERAKRAGFDGVEIHSAHGYLLNQFYSPLTNKRTDAYGETIVGRLKIHREIITAVRDAIGEDMILGLRLGAADYMEGGNTIADGVAAAKNLAGAGLQYISVSGGLCGSRPKDKTGAGYFGDASEAIKKAVDTPIILTGGVQTSKDAEMLLREKKADMIGVARAIVADPDWARKALAELC